MSRKWFEIFAVFLLFLLLAFISTYPLILHFDTGIPYSPFGGPKVWNRSGDQIQLLYWFWLVKQNIMGYVPFDSNPFEFNMGIPYDTSGLNTIPLAFLYMIFSPLGDVTAYNCTIISSYLLAGVFMYLLVKLYSGSRTGALLAAVVFTLAPHRIRGFSAGHGYGLLYFCYPFILYYLELGIRSKKIRYGIISGVGLICLSMLEPHLIYYICVFLGIYIPIRILSLFSVNEKNVTSIIRGAQTDGMSCFSSLGLIYGAGASVIIYIQALFFSRDNVVFFSDIFWWTAAVYPFLLILLSLCFTAIYQRLTDLDFSECLEIEAKSLLPLYSALPLSILALKQRPPETGFLLSVLLAAVIAMKIWHLKPYLLMMIKRSAIGVWGKRIHITPVLPVIFSMGGIVFWMSSSKVKQVESTIAGGGRTLDDVALHSAKLSDLFWSMSNVYIGIVPAVIGGGVLLMILGVSAAERKRFLFVGKESFLRLFYITIAALCIVLSLGLAFDHVSLYALFFHYFPFFHYPRVSDRIITLGLFALAIVAGLVVRELQKRCPGGFSFAAVTLSFLLAIGYQLKDYNVMVPMGINILDRGQDIYGYIKKNIGDKFLLEIPLWPGDSHQSSLYQHYIMLDRVPRINGSSPMVLKEYVDNVFEPLASINQGRLDRNQFELLHRLGVKYITVHDNVDVFIKKVSPFVPLATVRRLQNSPYLEQIHMKNEMYFKTWKGVRSNLYLFKLKNADDQSIKGPQAWYAMPYFYDANWRLLNQIGEVVVDDELKKPVFYAAEETNTTGFLVYGPYDIYSQGDYRCYFSIRLKGSSEETLARLEVARVAADGDVTVLEKRDLQAAENSSSYRKEFVDFSIEENTKLEFRVFYYGIGEVSVEKVVVNKRGSDTPLNMILAEKMVGNTGLVQLEDDAISGKVVEAAIGSSEKGDMVYGPNRLYAKGRYMSRFLVRMQNMNTMEVNSVIAELAITDGQDNEVFAKREIQASDLINGRFVELELDFSLPRDEFLSFHLNYNGKATLQLDGIEVIPH